MSLIFCVRVDLGLVQCSLGQWLSIYLLGT